MKVGGHVTVSGMLDSPDSPLFIILRPGQTFIQIKALASASHAYPDKRNYRIKF